LSMLAAWLMNADEDDVYDYGYQGLPRCPICGRATAAVDCEPDPDLCWRSVSGSDLSCRPGRRRAPSSTPVEGAEGEGPVPGNGGRPAGPNSARQGHPAGGDAAPSDASGGGR
jgi:hypothetical protein